MTRIKFILFSMIIILLLGISVAAYGVYSGEFLLKYNARIVEFYACDDPLIHVHPSVGSIPRFSPGTQAIYVCGLLKGTTFRRIAFHWYKDDVHVYRILEQKVDLGSFYRLLPPLDKNGGYDVGNYRVDAYSGRVKIASTELLVE